MAFLALPSPFQSPRQRIEPLQVGVGDAGLRQTVDGAAQIVDAAAQLAGGAAQLVPDVGSGEAFGSTHVPVKQ